MRPFGNGVISQINTTNESLRSDFQVVDEITGTYYPAGFMGQIAKQKKRGQIFRFCCD
jgi:hypothetical protein